jgi:hypothetical protein
MSFLDVIKTCDNSYNMNNLIKFPFIESIVKDKFDINSKSLNELCDSLITFSYLNINSNKVVDQILWLIGDNKILFDQYFVEINDKPISIYDFKSDIDNIIKCEFMQKLKKPPYTKEQLNARFNDVDAIECVKCGNLRLLSWANTDGRSILNNINISISDIYISTMFKIANENKNYHIELWLYKEGFSQYRLRSDYDKYL